MSEDYREVLLKSFVERKDKNPSYSLRAFARDIQISPSQLSEVLNRKNGLSEESATKITKALGFNHTRSKYFCDLVASEHSRHEKRRSTAKSRIRRFLMSPHYKSIQQDQFKVIAEWYHFAILELTSLRNFRRDVDWIAKKLNVPKRRIALSVDRLFRTKMMVNVDGRFVPTETHEVISGVSKTDVKRAMRGTHKQYLSMAMKAIDEQPTETREFSSLVLALPRDMLPKLKEKIIAFSDEIADEVTRSGKTPNTVYCLGVQLYDLTYESKVDQSSE